MAWWSRLWRNNDSSGAPPEEDVLVISDIHLGEDVLTGGPDHLAQYIRVLNRELAEFITAHTVSTRGRSWHLVINGDMFDFVKVSVRPDPEEPEETYRAWTLDAAPRPSDDEDSAVATGLSGPDPAAHRSADSSRPIPNTPENVVWKLERILEIHRPMFKRMAAFLLAGNRVTIIEGNHDAEFFFEAVQRTLREFLVREAERQHRAQPKPGRPFEPERVANAVAFHSWFEASPGRYHIEHGHQYDEFCSFEYKLAPLDRPDAEMISTPMSHRLMPHFAEVLGDFSTHGVDQWSLGRWLRYVSTIQPAMMWTVVRIFIPAMAEILSNSGKRRRTQQLALAEQQEMRLHWLAENSPYGLRSLKALDRLRSTPAEYSVAKMLRLFYLDRFVAAVGWAGLMVLALLVGGDAGSLLGIGGTAVFGASLLAMFRAKRSNLDENLREAAARIAFETGARYVVFGHSHHPELVSLHSRHGVGRFGEESWYINSGSWVTREILLGEKGRGMTYVEISNRGAALKRWLGVGKTPAVLASTQTPENARAAERAVPESSDAATDDPKDVPTPASTA